MPQKIFFKVLVNVALIFGLFLIFLGLVKLGDMFLLSDSPEKISEDRVISCAYASFGETCTPIEEPPMFRVYRACSKKAETQVLERVEVEACMDAYSEVKLSFVAGMTPHTYQQLPRSEQADINRRAFLAFQAWQKSEQTDEFVSMVIN